MLLPASYVSVWKVLRLLLRAIMFPFPLSRPLVLGVHCPQIGFWGAKGLSFTCGPIHISLALVCSLESPQWLETVILLSGCLRHWAQTEPPSLVLPLCTPLCSCSTAPQLFPAGPRCSPRSEACHGCSFHLCSALPIRVKSQTSSPKSITATQWGRQINCDLERQSDKPKVTRLGIGGARTGTLAFSLKILCSVYQSLQNAFGRGAE